MHRVTGRWQLGLALALVTALCWGVLPVALAVTLAAMDPYTITWYRFAVAAIVLGLGLAATRRLPALRALDQRGWGLLAIALLGLVGNYVLYLLALEQTSPSVTQTVIQVAPICLLLGGLIFFKERFSRLQWLGFALLISGLALFFNRRLPELVEFGRGLGLGVLMLLVAAIVWAAYALAQKQLLKTWSSQQILWVLYLGAVLLLLPPSAPASVRTLEPMQGWFLGFCCANTLIAYGAFAEALEHWEVSRVSAVLSLSPLITLATMWLAAVLAPGLVKPEGLNALSVGGASLVVAGSALCALGGESAR